MITALDARTGLPAIVPELSSAELYFDLVDTDDQPIAGAAVISCKVTLLDKTSGAVIDTQSEVEMKDKIDPAGRFLLVLTPAQNAIISARPPNTTEMHVAKLLIRYNNGIEERQLTAEVGWTVENLQFTS